MPCPHMDGLHRYHESQTYLHVDSSFARQIPLEYHVFRSTLVHSAASWPASTWSRLSRVLADPGRLLAVPFCPAATGAKDSTVHFATLCTCRSPECARRHDRVLPIHPPPLSLRLFQRTPSQIRSVITPPTPQAETLRASTGDWAYASDPYSAQGETRAVLSLS
jgi:hypothetical protein